MFAIPVALRFILVNVYAQDEYCILKPQYREFYQRFHHVINSGIKWQMALEHYAKLEAIQPGSKTNDSLYIKVEKEKLKLRESRSKNFDPNFYEVIQLLKTDLVKVIALPYGSYFGCNGLYNTEGEDADNLKVVCLYRQSSQSAREQINSTLSPATSTMLRSTTAV